MTKKEIIEALLNYGIVGIQVLRVPDWDGGHRVKCVLLKKGEPEYGDPERPLGDFTYVEFSGDVSRAISHLGDEFWEHWEPQYDESYDCYYTLRALIISALVLL